MMYFPKPDIVEKYWSNSYVQEAKNLMLKHIKRDNPDIKLNQFEDMNNKILIILDY